VSGNLLELTGVAKVYPVPGSGRKRASIRAVDGVDLAIPRGRVFGLVGESGSGKTTVARCILGLTPLSEGSILFDGIDLAAAEPRARRGLRREIQIVFQQPTAALDPRMTVDNLIAEPLTTHRIARGAALRERVGHLLSDVGLSAVHLRRYPHELSGGQCQRVVIARALASGPRLVVLDEPTSALDIVVQAQILNLLVELRDRHGLTYLLISHDLSVVRHLSDRIGVMYLGRIVEEGPAAALLDNPRHPYTRALLASTRGRGSTTLDQPPPISGEMPSTWDLPSGCRFHTRCALREELGRPAACETTDPANVTVGADHVAACHFADHAGVARGGQPGLANPVPDPPKGD
jgi:oligopeptide/dipeptide ABC transporter ATP-binding protein